MRGVAGPHRPVYSRNGQSPVRRRHWGLTKLTNMNLLGLSSLTGVLCEGVVGVIDLQVDVLYQGKVRGCGYGCGCVGSCRSSLRLSNFVLGRRDGVIPVSVGEGL